MNLKLIPFLLLFSIGAALAGGFPTVAELRERVASSQAVFQEDSGGVWFIQDGKVYRMDLATKESRHVSHSSKVASITSYAGTLVALRTTGEIFILEPDKEKWVELGNSTVTLLATEQDLIALTDKGELWIWQGSPGEINITYIPMTISTGKVTTITFIPMVNGRKVSFLNTGISNVAKIFAANEGDILIEYRNGNRESYRELGVGLDDLSRTFSLTENLDSLQFAGVFANGKTRQIKELTIEKGEGELYATIRYKVDKFWFPSSPEYKLPLSKVLPWLNGDGNLQEVRNFFTEVLIPLSEESKDSWRLLECVSLL